MFDDDLLGVAVEIFIAVVVDVCADADAVFSGNTTVRLLRGGIAVSAAARRSRS